ncbi:N-acetylmuramoyl-L-alanine amidase, partial [Xanthomonas oryzae pv. oryzae]
MVRRRQQRGRAGHAAQVVRSSQEKSVLPSFPFSSSAWLRAAVCLVALSLG